MTTTDLTFFTNEEGASLLDRFKATLSGVQYFDVLVGYFRTSGFYLLYDALEDVEKIRILVGLNVDREALEIIDTYAGEVRQLSLDFEQSSKETKESFAEHVADELAHADDAWETEEGVRKFIEFLRSGKLEIRAWPEQNIHAKVYIQRFRPDDRDFGRVITGSSNFSYSGFLGQYEFNVELKNKADVEFALHQFEDLWERSVDLSDIYVDTVQKRTWLNNDIQPYELYLKFLYEYFKEEINADDGFEPFLPEGFMDLAYQRQAVISARRILNAYNGVFLADVVGLGKTFISALLAQQLNDGHILVICPPVLKDYWEDTFRDFRVPARVESMGKLKHIINEGYEKYKYVFIDEAHRFRNENTQQYELLHKICWGKKVILVSATPFNNRIEDIKAQLKLFQPLKHSMIPGVPDLEEFFRGLRRRLNQYEKSDPGYMEELKDISRDIRIRVLSHVMVRRTRREIEKYYAEDLKEQGLTFPKVAEPQRIIYEFDDATERAFNGTITLLKAFQYARYTPLLYLRRGISDFEAQSQRNVGAFMKTLLVKRLESSIYAFRKTLRRFLQSYDRFIQMLDDGVVLISKTVDVYDLLDNDDLERIQDLVESGDVDRYNADDFYPEFREALVRDRADLQAMLNLWEPVDSDPKLETFIEQLQNNPLLRKKKLIIFTESAETAEYIYERLDEIFTDKVMYYTSQGGVYRKESLAKETARRLIQANYDPNYRSPEDRIRLLVTTDVLAEGINLHRSNIVVNYDLPWNPTRVLQRVGRVNRVGTQHTEIYIFNFFPTSQSDEHLGLEGNIISKIQAFHDMLGEDAKYLSPDEEVTQHDLRGQVLYRQLSDKETYEGEEDEESDLEYLQVIRKVRDEDPDLFDRVKKLPIKARSGRHTQDAEVEDEALLTFIRVGALKKFFLSDGDEAKEVDFFQAVDKIACDPETPALTIPRSYYDMLKQNKLAFERLQEEENAPTPRRGGRSNVQIVIKFIRTALRDTRRMTDEDEQFLRDALRAFSEERLPSKTSKRVAQELKKLQRPTGQKIVDILRRNVDERLLEPLPEAPRNKTRQKREIILSVYLKRTP